MFRSSKFDRKILKGLNLVVASLASMMLVIVLAMHDTTAAPSPSTPAGGVIYVATTGNDRNPGTIDQPFRTIQKGVDAATPGTTVQVRGGTYSEQVKFNVSGSGDSSYVTLQSYPGEQAIVDGKNLNLPRSEGLLTIEDGQYIKVANLTIQNAIGVLPFGILIGGTSNHIQIRDNKIAQVRTTEKYGHGLMVSNHRANASIHDIVISGNSLSDINTSGEALAIMGNVERVEVTKNQVDLKSNPTMIGIDVLGNYDDIDDPNVGFARDVMVSENVVSNGGICLYVDGASRVTFERNRVSNCAYGIQITSEKKDRPAVDNVARNNVVSGCRDTCLSFGAWVPEYGEAVNCTFDNNTVFADGAVPDNGYVRGLAINRSRGCRVVNNIISSSNGALLQNNGSNDASLDYNLWYATGSAGFNWSGKWSRSLDEYRNISGQDSNSLFADPLFSNSNSASVNLSLQANSPAINRGNPSYASGETDFNGNPRIANSRVDIGAYEQ